MNLARGLTGGVISPPKPLDQGMAICARERTVWNFVPHHLKLSLVLGAGRDDSSNGRGKHPKHA